MRKKVKHVSSKTLIPNTMLKQERKKHHWSQKDLAKLIGSNEATISRWERGTTTPRIYHIAQLVEMFNTSEDLLGFVDTPPETIAFPRTENNAQKHKFSHTLPHFIAPLIGREKELTELYQFLGDPSERLITLVGPGGVGKTHLAIEVARKIREDRSDSVCFISLSEIHDKNQMYQTVAQQLGMRKTKRFPTIDQIGHFISDASLLLVLDTIEHLIHNVTELKNQLENLLYLCPHLTLLVTSREVLHLRMEHKYPVTTLSIPDPMHLLEPEVLKTYPCITLFIQQAQCRKQSFHITKENASDIVDLCYHLDGLPLAVELAAPSITLFSPYELKEHIIHHLYTLSRELLFGPERHRSLYNNVKWSYDLLNTHEQWFLRQFSVFVGGATLKTIEDVFATEEHSIQSILECVRLLINKNLLDSSDCLDSQVTRITMLKTTHTFVYKRLQEKGELEQISALHAMYYLEMVEAAMPVLKKEQQDSQLLMLKSEQTNLHAALTWLIKQKETIDALRFCEAFGKFYGLYGEWEEERHFLHTVLDLPQVSEGRAIRARVLRRAGHLSYRLRDFNQAVVWLNESVTISRDVEDKQNLAGALSCLGWTCYRQNKMEEAHIYLQQSVEAAYSSNDDWTIANTLESWGRHLFYQKDISAAYSCLQDSMAIARNLQDKETAVRILMIMVKMEIECENVNKAKAFAEESLALARVFGTKPLIALALHTSGDAAQLSGDYEEAKKYFNDSISLARDLHDWPAVESRSLKLVEIALHQDDIQTIRTFLQESSGVFKVPYDGAAIENIRQHCQRYIEERKNKIPY